METPDHFDALHDKDHLNVIACMALGDVGSRKTISAGLSYDTLNDI